MAGESENGTPEAVDDDGEAAGEVDGGETAQASAGEGTTTDGTQDDAAAASTAPTRARSEATGGAAPADTPPQRIAELVAAAQQAQRRWADMPLADRADALLPVKRRLLERADEIAGLLHAEVGKPVEEAVLAEVLPNADLVDWWCDNIEELLEGQPVDLDPLSYPAKRGRIHRDARGVVALITPYNYPVAIPLRTLVPALLAGNAVVFKPSEHSPRSGALVASLFDGLLPEGLLAVVQGGRAQGRVLVDGAVDLVVFTGGVDTGRAIAARCGERLVPCSLELGGKDAAVVLEDCNLERTARGLVWGAFTNAGQNCAAIERVYVVSSVAERLVARVVELTKALRMGAEVGPLATRAQLARVRSHCRAALAAGAELLTGGPPDDEDELAFPPTVLKLAEPAQEHPFMTDETFGPLLPIVVVEGEDEAIEHANASRYALTTSIWTKRIHHARGLVRRLRAGVVTINNHAFSAALPAAPWAGSGDSGYGITGSRHALDALTRVRFVLADRNRRATELWWYPYTPALRAVAFAMAGARGGARWLGRIAAFFRLLAALPRRLFER